MFSFGLDAVSREKEPELTINSMLLEGRTFSSLSPEELIYLRQNMSLMNPFYIDLLAECARRLREG